MTTDRRSFLKTGTGGGLVALFLRNPIGRLAARLVPNAFNWGRLKFSTGAVRTALPHPAVQMTVNAVTAASTVLLAAKSVQVAGRPASTSALLRISTNAIRAGCRNPCPTETPEA